MMNEDDNAIRVFNAAISDFTEAMASLKRRIEIFSLELMWMQEHKDGEDNS